MNGRLVTLASPLLLLACACQAGVPFEPSEAQDDPAADEASSEQAAAADEDFFADAPSASSPEAQQGTQPPTVEPLEPPARPRVLLTFVSQNEARSPWTSLSGDPDAWIKYRRGLVERVELLASFGARLHYQVDSAVLDAVEKLEGPDGAMPELREDTRDRNVLAWMFQDMGMSVDPHATLPEMNHADLAYRLSRLDVRTNVVAAPKLYQCAEAGRVAYADWHEALQLDGDGAIRGRTFQDVLFHPVIVSSPTMEDHAWGEYSSGVWKPGKGRRFVDHDPGGSLVYVGQGYPHDAFVTSEVGGKEPAYAQAGFLRELVERIDAGEIYGDGLLTVSINVPDDPSAPLEHDQLLMLLRVVRELVDAGKVEHASLNDARLAWEDMGMPHSRVRFEQMSGYERAREIAVAACSDD